MELNDRLRTARIKAGYDSAADAARRLSMPYGTYSGHENGQRGIKREDISRYARAFGVSRSWLEYGQEINFTDREEIEVLGEVGKLSDAEARWYTMDDQSPMVLLPKIIDCKLSALHVASKGLSPYAYNNYMLFFNSIFTQDYRNSFGSMFICILRDQRVFVRRIYESGNTGKYDLEFPGMETLRSVEVVRASPVLFVLTDAGYRLVYKENMLLADKIASTTMDGVAEILLKK